MKTKVATIVLLVLVAFSSCDKEARERRKKMKPITEESIESLVDAVDAIDWNNHYAPGPGLDETNEPCYQNLMNMIRLMPKLEVDKNRLEELKKVFAFSRLIQEPIDEGKFGEIEGHDLDRRIVPYPIRDRILRKVDIDLENEDFVRQVKGTGNLSVSDRGDLAQLYSEFHNEIKNKPAILGVASRRMGNCTLNDLILIRMTGVQPGNKVLTYRVKRQFTFLCDCDENSDGTQPKYGYVQFESNLTASYEANGLYNLVFGNASRPEMTGLNIVCCRNAEDGSEEQEEEHDQHEEGGH